MSAIYRVQKKKNYTVMSNTHLRDKRLSLKAIGLLSLILSLPEKHWQFSIRGLVCICKDGVDAVREDIKELERNGYIVCSRVRKENGQLGESVYLIYEAPISGTGSNELGSTDIPETQDPEAVSSRPENPVPENPTQGFPGAENPTRINTDILNTNKENKDKPTTDPSYPYPSIQSYLTLHLQDGESTDQLSTINALTRKVRDQIGYDILIHRFAKDEVDNIVSLIEEGLAADCQYFKIGCNQYPPEVVRQRFSELNRDHIEYVLECLKKSSSEIRNIKQYLMTVLFNAPSAMSSRDRMLARHSFDFSKQYVL